MVKISIVLHTMYYMFHNLFLDIQLPFFKGHQHQNCHIDYVSEIIKNHTKKLKIYD